MSRSRNYVYTLNNYSLDDVAKLKEVECRYHVMGYERGESGTPHLQGMIAFKLQKTLGALKKLNPKAHWEVMMGTFQEASDYCKKDGDFWEHGTLPMTQAQKGQCNVERFEIARQLAKEGRFDEIPADIYIRYDKSLKRIRADAIKPEIIQGELEHEWWYGPPGCGKTSEAIERHPEYYMKDPQERWWDGYDGEEVVIIDDFDKYQKAQGGDMKRWLDRYPFQAPFKGGYKLVRPRKVIVTSNYHPNEIWDDDVTQEAIGRRVKIRKMGHTPFTSNVVSSYKPL